LANHPNQGGLGLINITANLDSLRCAHLSKFVTGTEANWKFYTVFWAGLQLRRFNDSFAAALIPHAERPSVFYDKTIETYRKICEITPIIEPKALKSSNAHKTLQLVSYTAQVVVSKFPHIDYSQAFSKLKDRLFANLNGVSYTR